MIKIGFSLLAAFVLFANPAIAQSTSSSSVPSLPKASSLEYTFKTENFSIHYTIEPGQDQVSGWDQDNATVVSLPDHTIRTTHKGTGVTGADPYSLTNAPDYVEEAGIYLEYSLQKYLGFGFNNGQKPEWISDVDIESTYIFFKKDLAFKHVRGYTVPLWEGGHTIHLDKGLGYLDDGELRTTEEYPKIRTTC